ncbi:MAG: RadC family protein [Eubacteriales bacterium]
MGTVNYRPTIKELPAEMRPRERLMKEGPEALSDQELLAILLRTGSHEVTALELASKILALFQGLGRLVDASVEELSEVKGIGMAKASQVKAALELARRLSQYTGPQRPVIRSPEDAAGLVMEEMRHLDREHFRAILLDTKNHVIATEKISVGTLNSSTVHPRELFRNAIKRSAAAIILLHNHPSGDPSPSQEDIDITGRVAEAGNIIGISVLDHIVIGDNKFTSFKARGLL